MRGKRELTLSSNLEILRDQLLKHGFLQHDVRVPKQKECNKVCVPFNFIYAHFQLDYYVISLRRWINETRVGVLAKVNALSGRNTPGQHCEVVGVELNKIQNSP